MLPNKTHRLPIDSEKGMPIKGAPMKGMPVSAKGAPFNRRQKSTLKRINGYARKIKANPEDKRNEKYAEEIMKLVDKLLK